MKTRVLLSSIFFIADSVVSGNLRIWERAAGAALSRLREANPRARQPCMAFARLGGTASARGCGSGRLVRRSAAGGEDSALPASRVASAGDAGSEG